MRKSIWVALAATLALSSCFKTVEKPGDGLPANPVVFSEKVEEYEAQTRAMDGHPIENVPNQTNKGLIPIGKSFGVWAWSHDGATATKFTDLDNKSVTRAANDGEKAVYTYTPTATWPNTPLSFLAYYPHSGSADFAANGGMGTPTVATDGTTMTIPYTVPTIGEKHIDLMYARKGETEGYDPVELEFRHALSRMKFSALIDGFNDGEEDARALRELLFGMNCHVNLIALNGRGKLKAPPKRKVYAFCARLTELGLSVTVRKSMGGEIEGACGQLRQRRIEQGG